MQKFANLVDLTESAMLQKEYLIAKIGFDRAENAPSKAIVLQFCIRDRRNLNVNGMPSSRKNRGRVPVPSSSCPPQSGWSRGRGDGSRRLPAPLPPTYARREARCFQTQNVNEIRQQSVKFDNC